MPPLISVIIPVHNRQASIRACLSSVLSQTYQDCEIWVIDDGSTDRTLDEIKNLKDNRINIISLPSCSGAQAARNIGIRHARGEWIAFLDSDDEYYPNSLDLRLEYALKSGVNVVHSNVDVRKAYDGKVEAFKLRPLNGNIYAQLLLWPGPMFQSLLVKKECLERISYLDEDIVSYQEWDTSIRLAKYSEFAFVPEPTFLYNLAGDDKISRDDRRSIQGYLQVVNKHEGEILRLCGPKAMARHILQVAKKSLASGDRTAAWNYYRSAWKWSPFETRWLAYLPFFILGPGTYNSTRHLLGRDG